jgi:hypothetical protein
MPAAVSRGIGLAFTIAGARTLKESRTLFELQARPGHRGPQSTHLAQDLLRRQLLRPLISPD